MARQADPRRDDAIAALRRLTAQHGAKEGARLAREQFRDVPAGTWGRWRQQAVGNVTDANAQALTSMADEVRRVIPKPEALGRAMADPIPAANRALRFWEEMDLLLADADLLRAYALTTGQDGRLKVRVPRALVDAASMRRDLLKIALAQAEVAFGVQRAQEFFDTIIHAIGQESPECQRRIMERLRLVQSEAASRGF